MSPALGGQLEDRPRVSTRNAKGFALIDLIFVAGMISLLCAIALPRFLLAKQAAGSASAVASIRSMSSAQLTYALTCGNGFYSPNLTTLGVAPPGSTEPFITPGLSVADTITRSGYIFRLEAEPYAGAPETCNGLAAGGAGQGFRAGADPAEPMNVRFFATNANGMIFEDVASLFADMPEVGEPLSGHVLQ